jgi:hypothetical protein
MRKALAATIIGVLSVVGSLALTTTPASADTISSVAESAFVAKINALRASKGLGQLAVYPELVSIARNWSQNMANAGDISHNANFPNQVTADWRKLGENVGRGGDVDSLFTAFVNSPHHYENLVDPAFNYVGVGVVVKSDGTMFTSHQFMQLGSAAAPAPAPRPAAVPRVTTPRVTTPRPATTPRATTPRAATAPSTPAPTPAAAPAPKPAPVPPPRIVLSLEQLQGLAAA